MIIFITAIAISVTKMISEFNEGVEQLAGLEIQNIDFNMNCDFEDIKTKTNEMSYLVEDLMEKIEEFKEVVSISHFRDGKISRLGI